MIQQRILIDACPRDDQPPLLRTADQVGTEKMARLHLSTPRRNRVIIPSETDRFPTKWLVRLQASPMPKAKQPKNGRRR